MISEINKFFLIVVIFLAVFYRLHEVENIMIFHGEIGHNYLVIKDLIHDNQIPLLGPPTSHPWLSFGPLFYWIFAPILFLSNYNPISGAYFFALVGVVVIIANFVFISKIFNEKTGLISAFLLAVSPAFISLAREARFFSLVVLIFYPFLYFLTQALKNGQAKYFLLLGVALGVMLNFHLTPIIFLPGIIVAFYLKDKKVPIGKLSLALVGLLLTQIPFLLYNFKTNFSMLTKFLIWLPYRTAGFLGVYPKNSFTIGVLTENSKSLFDFFKSVYLADYLIGSLIIGIIAFGSAYFWAQKSWKTKTLLILFGIGYLGIFIHGSPPSHYYLPLFPIPLIFLALFLGKQLKKRRQLVIFLLAFYLVLNSAWFFTHNHLGQNIAYPKQLEVAKAIIKEADNRQFSLKRVGQYDYFEGNYAQNYHYLLWWLGNEPVENSDLSFTIYEKDGNLSYRSSQK